MSLTVLRARVERSFAKLQRLYDVVKIADESENVDVITSRCENLGEDYASFEEVMTKYLEKQISEAKDSTEEEAIVKTYNSTWSAYEDLFAAVKLKFDNCKKVESSVQKRQSCSVKLPKIELKGFDGNVINWSLFHENFKALIHENKSLNDLEKFHYLISSLNGSAVSFVSHVPVTAANYMIVWKNLEERYNDKRTLGANLLDSIIEYAPLTNATAFGLNNLVGVLNDNREALKSIPIEDLSDFVLLHLALKKLPVNIRKLFESHFINKEIPTYDNLLEFLRQQAKIIEMSTPQKREELSPKLQLTKGVYLSQENPVKSKNCVFCQQEHFSFTCPDLLKSPISSRRQKVKDLRLCFNCLGRKHIAKECPSNRRCKECDRKHHTILHQEASKFAAAATSEDYKVKPETRVSLTSRSESLSVQSVLLGTAVIHVEDVTGKYHKVRAVIDSAAMTSFITEACARKLKLNRKKSTISFSGITDKPLKSSEVVTCTIKPTYKPDSRLKTEAVVVPVITSSLPTVQLSERVKVEWTGLALADPSFADPGPVELLIGADLYPYIYTGRKIFKEDNCGCALQSIFGWVITGRVKQKTNTANSRSLLSVNISVLEKTMCKFWQVEEPPEIKSVNPDDEISEELYRTQHYRNSEGRYVVPLLLKTEDPVLSDSFYLAQNRLVGIERKLNRVSKLKEDYSAFMDGYRNLGYMSEVSGIGNGKYYIPHHCVIRESSLSTKLRVVFDASMQTTEGTSLNNVLYTGPKLQHDIIDIIARFRINAIAYTTDIEKMFRQILIRPEDRGFQHILWRVHLGVIKEYELNTVTYGTASAPYLANRTIIQIAEDESQGYEKAAAVLRGDIYVDDIISGADSLQEVKETIGQLKALLKKGGFELKKWASSNSNTLEDLEEDQKALKLDFHKPDETSLAVLGIQWVPVGDYFTINKLEFDTKISKRVILSSIARIYDPMGWITPVVLVAKTLIQQLWRLGLNWDESLPQNLTQQWLVFKVQLNLLSELKIPRYILNPKNKEVLIIGFADASETGYGAVVYLKQLIPSHSQNKVHLVIAKSKVAPLKPLSVPRLELCGAFLLSKLMQFVQRKLSSTCEITKVIALTDSTTVLSWLSTPPYLLKTYVANRVVNIMENIPNEAWAHVRTDQNPADLASRGVNPSQIVNNSFWWYGPHWLNKDVNSWPISSLAKVASENNTSAEVEIKTNKVFNTTMTESSLIERFSSLEKLQRVTAWILRFFHNSKGSKREENKCKFPSRWEGTWFQSGVRSAITIEDNKLSNKGKCLASEGDKFLVVDEKGVCFRCVVIHEKHANVLQYKETFCLSRANLSTLCALITGDALLYSMFREVAQPVPCPFKPPHTFTYNRGHGECRSPISSIESCTQDSRILLRYQACPDVYGSESAVEELQCLATWKEGSSRYLVGKVHHNHATSNEDRYRCFVYEKTGATNLVANMEQYGAVARQSDEDVEFQIAQSGDATCNGLFTPLEGSRTMTLRKGYTPTKCKFPNWLTGSGHWHTLDYKKTYSFHHRNTTLRISETIMKESEGQPSHDGTKPYAEQLWTAPPPDQDMRVVCTELKQVTAEIAHLVAHYTMGCQSGFVCLAFYKRDDHVIEVQTGTNTHRQEEACGGSHFDRLASPYTTLVTSNPEQKTCPYSGKYTVSGPRIKQRTLRSQSELSRVDVIGYAFSALNPHLNGLIGTHVSNQANTRHSRTDANHLANNQKNFRFKRCSNYKKDRSNALVNNFSNTQSISFKNVSDSSSNVHINSSRDRSSTYAKRDTNVIYDRFKKSDIQFSEADDKLKSNAQRKYKRSVRQRLRLARSRRDLESTSFIDGACSSDFKSLNIGCGGAFDSMEFRTDCPSSSETVSVYSCHGGWVGENGSEHYLITTPLSRSSRGPRRYCFIYRLTEDGTTLRFTSSPDTCRRENAAISSSDSLVLNITLTGKCLDSNSAQAVSSLTVFQQLFITWFCLAVSSYLNCR